MQRKFFTVQDCLELFLALCVLVIYLAKTFWPIFVKVDHVLTRNLKDTKAPSINNNGSTFHQTSTNFLIGHLPSALHNRGQKLILTMEKKNIINYNLMLGEVA